MKKNNLDEMQEQALLKIEHNGCWLAFLGLLGALLVEGVLGFGMRAMAGELVVFMGLSLYICIDCLHKGIWDRQLKPNWKTNLITSSIAGIIVCVFTALRINLNYPGFPVSSIFSGLIAGVITFALCFAAISLCAALYRKRKEKLENE